MEFGKKIPDVYYRRREAVYAVVLEKNKKVAIIVQNGKGFLPGDGLEIAEEHHTALKRECMEETGFIFELNQYVGQAEQYFQTRQ
jgi:8-oxo-dGTP diphosphatase